MLRHKAKGYNNALCVCIKFLNKKFFLCHLFIIIFVFSKNWGFFFTTSAYFTLIYVLAFSNNRILFVFSAFFLIYFTLWLVLLTLLLKIQELPLFFQKILNNEVFPKKKYIEERLNIQKITNNHIGTALGPTFLGAGLVSSFDVGSETQQRLRERIEELSMLRTFAQMGDEPSPFCDSREEIAQLSREIDITSQNLERLESYQGGPVPHFTPHSTEGSSRFSESPTSMPHSPFSSQGSVDSFVSQSSSRGTLIYDPSQYGTELTAQDIDFSQEILKRSSIQAQLNREIDRENSHKILAREESRLSHELAIHRINVNAARDVELSKIDAQVDLDHKQMRITAQQDTIRNALFLLPKMAYHVMDAFVDIIAPNREKNPRPALWPLRDVSPSFDATKQPNLMETVTRNDRQTGVPYDTPQEALTPRTSWAEELQNEQNALRVEQLERNRHAIESVQGEIRRNYLEERHALEGKSGARSFASTNLPKNSALPNLVEKGTFSTAASQSVKQLTDK